MMMLLWLVIAGCALVAAGAHVAVDAFGWNAWPWWAWLVVADLALHLAQFLAWSDMRRDRDLWRDRLAGRAK